MAKSYIDLKRKGKTLVTIEFSYSRDIYKGRPTAVLKAGKPSDLKQVKTELREPWGVYIPELGGTVGAKKAMPGVWGWVAGVAISMANAANTRFDEYEIRNPPPANLFKEVEPLPEGAIP